MKNNFTAEIEDRTARIWAMFENHIPEDEKPELKERLNGSIKSIVASTSYAAESALSELRSELFTH